MAHADAAEAQLDRNMGIGRVVHHHNDGQRREAFAPFLPQLAVTLLAGQCSAQRSAPGNAPVVTRFAVCRPWQAGVIPGRKGRCHAELGKAIHHRGERLAENGFRIESRATDEWGRERARQIVGQQVTDGRLAGSESREEVL